MLEFQWKIIVKKKERVYFQIEVNVFIFPALFLSSLVCSKEVKRLK